MKEKTILGAWPDTQFVYDLDTSELFFAHENCTQELWSKFIFSGNFQLFLLSQNKFDEDLKGLYTQE